MDQKIKTFRHDLFLCYEQPLARQFATEPGGKLTFMYRVLLHSYGYEKLKASRFGMEQSEPLIVVPVKQGYWQIVISVFRITIMRKIRL